jgi:predicted transcriptional regulator
MFIEKERPVTVAVDPKLEIELKLRKQELENETGKPIRGGLTTYSKMAAQELECIRKSGEDIYKNILKLEQVPIHNITINGENKQVVEYDFFKKLFIFVKILNKKKDQRQIQIDVSKLKGMKKNEINIFW